MVAQVAPATDQIKVGDTWECFRTKHRGWRIKIRSLSTRGVEYELLRGPSSGKREHNPGRGRYLMRSNLLRDFVLVHAAPEVMTKKESPLVLEPPVITHDEAERFRVCKSCEQLLPIERFDLAVGRGATTPGTRVKTCHPCLVEHRAEGIRAHHAAKLAAKLAVTETPETPVEPAPEPEPVPEPKPAPTTQSNGHVVIQAKTFDEVEPKERTGLAMALLELAAQADALEHPPAYKRLFDAALTAVESGSETHGVLVIGPVEAIQLQEAVAAARRELDPIKRHSAQGS